VAHLQPDGTWLEINDNAWGDPGHPWGTFERRLQGEPVAAPREQMARCSMT